MAERKVWIYLQEMTLHIVAIDEKNDIYWQKTPVVQISKLQADLMEAEDLPKALDFKEEPLRVRDITEATANSVGDLVLKVDDTVALKLEMRGEGVKILEEIQSRSNRSLELDVTKSLRLGGAAIAMLIGIGVAALLVFVFYGVDSGQINRIHWLMALIINIFGHYSLLIFAAIALLIGGLSSIYYLVTPAEHWSLT